MVRFESFLSFTYNKKRKSDKIMFLKWTKRILYGGGIGLSGYAIYKYYENKEKRKIAHTLMECPPQSWKPSSRKHVISCLKTKLYDILIIGGGISGSGCALDGASRGLKVAMVESGDFGQETSSKTTKLIHGGVRYLEQAFKKLDLSNLKLVVEALFERKFILDSFPYLAKPVRLMLPVYNRLMIPYFLAGLKLYDYFSWRRSLGNSYFMSTKETVKNFPNIEKSKLKGSIVYYDGIHDDSRSNLMVALTAAYYNADVLNYCKVIDLIRKNGIVVGAIVEDVLKNEIFRIKAKCVISTVGPFTDQITKMANKESKNIVCPSSGTHLVVPKEFGVKEMGLLDPSTKDKRILFFIPWMNKTILGSTDNPSSVKKDPTPTKDEIEFILKEANNFLQKEKQLSIKNVLSVWTGIRPLVKNPNCRNTKDLARTHIVYKTDENLIVLAGGKWTTYRAMAEDAINLAIEKFNLVPKRPCLTPYLKMLGSHEYNSELSSKLQSEIDINEDEAQHLIDRYGDRAFKIANYKKKHLNKLHKDYPFTEEEVSYSIDHEMACRPIDILTRRMRLGFIDVKAAEECLDKVLEIFKNKMNLSEKKLRKERYFAIEYLNTLGLSLLKS